MTVAQALAAVMADVPAVKKDDKNQAQGFSYRGIDGVLNVVGPALRKHGVLVLPEVLSSEHRTMQGRNSTLNVASVHVRYRFVGPEGDELACDVVAESFDAGDKAVTKAMSVAFRTALLQALAIPTHEPDPDSVSYELGEPAPSDRVSAGRAKSEILEAVGGDRDRAKELWEAHKPATRGGLDELLAGVS